jgi:hypothetical protein
MDKAKYKNDKELERVPSMVRTATTPQNPPSIPPHPSCMLNEAAVFRNAFDGTAGMMLGLSPSPPSRNSSSEWSTSKTATFVKESFVKGMRKRKGTHTLGG